METCKEWMLLGKGGLWGQQYRLLAADGVQ